MQTRVRTTITLPDHLLRTAKIMAIHQKKPLSELVAEALEDKFTPKKNVPTQDPMRLLGKYSLGIKSKLHRKDLYAEHIKHKMAY